MAKEKSRESILKSFIISTLRRASYRWVGRTEALRSARIERGLYQCNICKEKFKNKDIRLDHIAPIIPVSTGFVSWDDYINRLFCDASDMQVLCLTCHESKTNVEKEQRLFYRKKRKSIE